jgi:hypothetical protein
MTIRLEFIGQPGPHRNVRAFVERVRAANPSLTDPQVESVVRRANATYKPRFPQQVWTLFGADILSDTLTSMDAWQLLDPSWRRDLPLFPMDGGHLITGDDAPQLAAAIQHYSVNTINRRSLLVPAGLSKTYVWRRENAWIQEVADPDVAIIRQTPILNQCFRNPDGAAGPVTVERYERRVADRHTFATINDLEAFERDQQRRTLHKGVSV